MAILRLGSVQTCGFSVNSSVGSGVASKVNELRGGVAVWVKTTDLMASGVAGGVVMAGASKTSVAKVGRTVG